MFRGRLDGGQEDRRRLALELVTGRPELVEQRVDLAKGVGRVLTGRQPPVDVELAPLRH